MTAKLLCKAAYVPLLMAGVLSVTGPGCKKKNSLPASGSAATDSSKNQTGSLTAFGSGINFSSTQLVCIDDTGQHRFQIYGTAVVGSDTTVLALYFPDTPTAIETTVEMDGNLATVQYFDAGNGRSYSQSTGNAYGLFTNLTNNRGVYQVNGTFSGTLNSNGFETSSYANGFETDSTITMTTGSFNTNYIIK